jgi:hypothetical protein
VYCARFQLVQFFVARYRILLSTLARGGPLHHSRPTKLQYILVPSHIEKQYAGTLAASSRYHISKKERNFMLRNGLAEWLDQKNHILRRIPKFNTTDSFESGSGLVSMLIPIALQGAIVADMSR